MKRILATVLVIACVAAPAYAEKKPAKAPEKTSEKTPEKTPEKTDAPKAASTVLPCPESISVAPQEIAKKAPEGWRSFNDDTAKYPVESVQVYRLEGKELVKLSPGKGTESYTEWMLADNGHEKYYMGCAYAHTSVLLKKQLEPAFAFCRADAPKPGASVQPGLNCR